MAETQDSSAAEPSMEEILASIRKIIADDKEAAAPEPAASEPAPAANDVLELTQMVQDDGSVVDLAPAPPPPPVEEPPAPTPVLASPPAPEPEPAPPALEPVSFKTALDENLIADEVASAATSSLAALASTVQIERMAAMPAVTPLGNGAKTLEDMVMELMKPMLKQWLDQNLPATVERIVQKEVERIARRLQN